MTDDVRQALQKDKKPKMSKVQALEMELERKTQLLKAEKAKEATKAALAEYESKAAKLRKSLIAKQPILNEEQQALLNDIVEDNELLAAADGYHTDEEEFDGDKDQQSPLKMDYNSGSDADGEEVN
jgi:hypothetical protein